MRRIKSCCRNSKKINHIVVAAFCLVMIQGCRKQGESFPLLVLAPPEKPNIILILADDYGYEVPQFDGGQSYHTPNLNVMAQQGVRFTQCHSTALCSPSRFMLLTGKYNFRNYNTWGVMDT